MKRAWGSTSTGVRTTGLRDSRRHDRGVLRAGLRRWSYDPGVLIRVFSAGRLRGEGAADLEPLARLQNPQPGHARQVERVDRMGDRLQAEERGVPVGRVED